MPKDDQKTLDTIYQIAQSFREYAWRALPEFKDNLECQTLVNNLVHMSMPGNHIVNPLTRISRIIRNFETDYPDMFLFPKDFVAMFDGVKFFIDTYYSEPTPEVAMNPQIQALNNIRDRVLGFKTNVANNLDVGLHEELAEVSFLLNDILDTTNAALTSDDDAADEETVELEASNLQQDVVVDYSQTTETVENILDGKIIASTVTKTNACSISWANMAVDNVDSFIKITESVLPTQPVDKGDILWDKNVTPDRQVKNNG